MAVAGLPIHDYTVLKSVRAVCPRCFADDPAFDPQYPLDILDGHLVACPRCGGKYPIIASGRRRHAGLRIAYLGDFTTCGATLVRV